MDFLHWLLIGIGVGLEIALIVMICRNEKLKQEVEFWKRQSRNLERGNELWRVKSHGDEIWN